MATKMGTMEIIQLLLLSVRCLAEPTMPAIVNARKIWSDFSSEMLKFRMRFQPEPVRSRRARTSALLRA